MSCCRIPPSPHTLRRSRANIFGIAQPNLETALSPTTIFPGFPPASLTLPHFEHRNSLAALLEGIAGVCSRSGFLPSSFLKNPIGAVYSLGLALSGHLVGGHHLGHHPELHEPRSSARKLWGNTPCCELYPCPIRARVHHMAFLEDTQLDCAFCYHPKSKE